jgi:hypothetical protein
MDALTAQSIRRLSGRLEAMRAGGAIPALMAEHRVGAPTEECRPLPEFEAAPLEASVRLPAMDTWRAVWLTADGPRVAAFRATCADAARVAIPTLQRSGFAVGLGAASETAAWLWSIFEMAALQLPGVPLRLEGGDVYRVNANGVRISERSLSRVPPGPAKDLFAAIGASAGPTRYWRLMDAIEASLAVLDVAQTWPQSDAAVTATAAPPCEPADEQNPTPRGEVAAERLRQLWADPEGRKKILAAGSAERIGQLIGRGKTAVVTAGRIWDEEIKPKLQAMRTVERYHREEERLDG